MAIDERTRILVLDPAGVPNVELVAAAARAGALGVLPLRSVGAAGSLLDAAASKGLASFAISVVAGDPDLHRGLPELLPANVSLVLVEAIHDDRALADAVSGLRRVVPAGTVLVAEVISLAQARAALDAGADGLVAKGDESGGAVGDTETFILLQQLLPLGVPVWPRGGIGLHTAPAAVAAGAAGVVLDAALALARESSLPAPTRQALGAVDGSETRVVSGYRLYTRPDLPAAALPETAPVADIVAQLGSDPISGLLPLGQDIAMAAPLAERFGTVGGIVQAVRRSIDEHLEAAAVHRPLARGRGVAASHGLDFPIAQGPMTRVSDRAAFAASVADGGALPFLALALLRAGEVRELLEETAALLGDRPWGVGVLGFVPPELRDEQLEVVREIHPPVALIAGGRPSQAQPLEADGIATYLHVPSPGLLDWFLKEGARRFVFEGRECGGHVGPRASFPLWDAQIEHLMAVSDPENLHVLFAGGIHDARSAAAVAAAGATLAARGAHLGVLMGTAYLFTDEAVAGGAIQPAFRDVAVSCRGTVLLETSPGHATRCVETEYVRAFEQRKAELEASGASAQEIWGDLESLNLGRLRIASKGIHRDGDLLVELAEDEQRREGMYMIGQVATLRDHPTTIADLHDEVSNGATERLASLVDRLSVREPVPETSPLDVAIVGMAAMFPGATDVHRFWSDILAGRNAITEVPARRWDTDRVYDPESVTRDAGRRTPSKWGGFLPPIEFDPLAYGIPPRSLAAIEPVQLLALEVAHRALCDAGYRTREFDRSRASVIFGAENGNDLSGAYGFRAMWAQLFGDLPDELEEFLPELTEDSFPGVLSNVIAGRIANRLDLGGVNYTVDAACAASLAAVDAACKELRNGTSDLVLCGGADLHNGINDYLLFASVHALSPTGQCRTFDASADGIALGEGMACVVLKRRVDAERDGDRVYAVIDAVAGSSDGRSLGLTAPRKEGQQRAVRRAYEQAGRPASTIGLVEAHGTGTVVGDRTEMATLTEVFLEDGAAPGSCVLGSVKSQIGHTKCAAGLAGLVKAARAVYAGVLPPTVNISEPNDYYDAETSPFRFLDRPRPWPATDRRAAVSAFGFGGANFHAVISSHPGAERPAHGRDEWPAELFLLRARSADDLDRRLDELSGLVAHIREVDPDGARHALRDLAATVSSAGRGPVRAAIVADDLTDLADKLVVARSGTHRNDGVFLTPADGSAGEVAFLYPGQGSQRPGMLADLFVAFPRLQEVLGAEWVDVLYPGTAFTPADRAAQKDAVTDTRVAQPVLGLAGLAISRLLDTFGVRPDLAAGHSYGELVALTTAGVLPESELLGLSTARADAIVAAAADLGDDPGTMAAVDLPADELRALLVEHPEVVLANHNSPRQSVVSGPTVAVEAAIDALTAAGVAAKRIPVACAFHSPLVAGASGRLAAALDEVEVTAPALPVFANSTAAAYPQDPADIRALLAGQVASPVRFVEQIEAMYEAGARVFVEVGPGRVLTQLVKRILGDRPHHAIACDASGDDGIRRFLLALGELASCGIDVAAAPLFEGRAELLDLRTLPVPAAGWLVDGGLVMTADGEPVAGGLQPADRRPMVHLGALAGLSPDEREETVREYLAGLRDVVSAQREVMLRYLGADPEAISFPRASIAEATYDAAATAPAELAPAPAADAAPLSGADLLATVLGIVADRTGYPTDMLDPDLDLEADLSIDSIKRIEIIGELAEKIGLAGADAAAMDGGIDESVVEELAQLKTLRAVVEWIESRAGGDGPGEASTAASAETTAPEEAGPPVPEASQRFLVEVVAAPDVDIDPASAQGTRVLVVGGSDALASEVTALLVAAGADADRCAWPPPDTIDLSAAERLGLVDGVVVLGDPDNPIDARAAFAVVQPAVLGQARRIVALTTSGGRFGRGLDHPPLRAGGIRGLFRAMAREFTDCHLRAVDVDPQVAPGAAARLLVDEYLDRALDPVVVGYAGDARVTTELVVQPTESRADDALPVGPESIVLVTGGARGITARVALALAAETGCRLELVGRSPLPDAEDPSLVDAIDRHSLRCLLLERRVEGSTTTPAEIEAACDRIEADREVRATMAALDDLGVQAEYHSLDVRDTEALGALVERLRAVHGRVDGIVHGAGVLDDRFVRDKTAEGFDRVFSTKVDAAHALLEHLGPDLRFAAFFGSISGVVGNRGQVDYAAANDALDELAWRAAASTPSSCRVVSIDWGPWAGTGMVSPELEREYTRRGIGLVGPDEGVEAFLVELARSADEPAQAVVLRGSPEAFAPSRPASATAAGAPTRESEVAAPHA